MCNAYKNYYNIITSLRDTNSCSRACVLSDYFQIPVYRYLNIVMPYILLNITAFLLHHRTI